MIRPAVFADVPGLRRLYAALTAELAATHAVAYPAYGADDLDSFTLLQARRLVEDPTWLIYVATDDATGELVGFLGGEVSERALGEPRVFAAAHWLYLVPTHRGRGLARALTARGVEDLAALGVTHVEVGAVTGDTQWHARGWLPYLVHYALPLAAVRAGVAERPAVDPTPTAPASPAPAPAPAAAPAAPRKRRRRRRSTPRPKLIAGGRA
jgi:GNAT superfamily N-acetyltransferase